MPKIATSFICFLITIVLIFTLVLPKKEALEFSQKRLEEKRAELQSKEEYFLNLRKISEELKNYQDQLSRIDSALPEDPGLPLLFNFLQKLAGQCGLTLTSIKTSLPSTEGMKEIKIDLALSGSYSSFKDFLSHLEKSARLFEIESLSFSTPKKETFEFKLNLKVHSY